MRTCTRRISLAAAKPPRSLFPLNLHGSAVAIRGAGQDHEIAARILILPLNQLTNWSDRIHDRCTRGIGHKTLQRFDNASARGLARGHDATSQPKGLPRVLQLSPAPLSGSGSIRDNKDPDFFPRRPRCRVEAVVRGPCGRDHPGRPSEHSLDRIPPARGRAQPVCGKI